MLRVCLTALHNEDDIDTLRDALGMVRKEEE
jgi:7-keto-8-aminopelargonate synthetase-like enzyme